MRRKAKAKKKAPVTGGGSVVDRHTAAQVRQALLAWYTHHQRALPWRGQRDPYAIWVSEVMLQQTQVQTVEPYYRRWLQAFPDLATLAAADEQEVLSLWAGLGYYSRARALHAGARRVVAMGGALPRRVEDLCALPGVGPYTAGAIASIAFDQDVPAVDGNVNRVLTRLFALGGDPTRGPLRRELWNIAAQLLPPGHARDFNQALMELGALCCTPKRPLCDRCPLQGVCKARTQGDPTHYPESRARPEITRTTHAAALVTRRGRVLLAQLSADAPRWAGMWVFPLTEPSADEPPQAAARRVLREWSGLVAPRAEEVDQVVHSVTRFRITLRLFRCDVSGGRARPGGAAAQLSWVNRARLDELAMPAAQRRLAQRLQLDDA